MYLVQHKKYDIPRNIYSNKINDKLVFKIKDRYKLELETPEFTKVFVSTKKLIDIIRNRENVPSLDVVQVVLAKWNLEDNQYQQKSKTLHTFTSNKSYACL